MSSYQKWDRAAQIERGEEATIDAVARYIETLGRRLDLITSSATTPSLSPPPKRPDRTLRGSDQRQPTGGSSASRPLLLTSRT
jgi:hypothetical protein